MLNAQTAADSKETVKPETAELRRQSFEKVWTTVNEKHYDPTFGGVDWKKARADYEPKALAAKSERAFIQVLNQMLGELKLSHFVVYQPTAVIENNKIGAGVVGIELKWIDNQAVISRIETASPANLAKLKTGLVIEKIGGKTVGELLASVEKFLAERNLPEAQKRILRAQVLLSFINGDTATKVKIEASDGKNQLQIFEVARAERKGEMSPAVGSFPPQEIVFEAKRLADGIGYIRFNIWVIPQMPKIREAIRSMQDAPGIIFDLRGNPGGIVGMAPGIAGYLTDKQTSLGTMKSRDNEMKFIVYPQTAPYAGKVVIIIDGGSGSTSEVFAAGMQEIERSKVVGETSAGQILVSLFEQLPTGAIFQHAISDYKSPKNILIESRGVIPDTEIKITRQTLLDGRDVQIEEAIKQIKNIK
jgi:carboxyl-terminal processing protease